MMKMRLEDLTKEQLIKILKLPGHLQKTMIAVVELEEATAKTVSEKTGRARAIESAYLNKLAEIGYLKKEKRKRRTYFSFSVG